MQTTVDLDPATLERAKRVARRENRTLGSVLSDALAAYVSRQPPRSSDPPFELIVRGRPGGRFPSAEELAKIEEEEETRALRIPEGRNAAS